MKKKIISLIVCVLLLTACGTEKITYKTITENEATPLIENDAIIIDVRSVDEYNTGHIVDSINIPVENISSVSYDKDQVIIVYCASGRRSANAAQELIDLGYTKVYNLDGGLINWGATLEGATPAE